MKNKMNWALNGVLLAASVGTLFATPVLQFQGQTYNIGGGGQFAARLSTDPNQVLAVYCVDFNNSVNPSHAYDVNVSTAGNLANTRYGATATSAFTYQTSQDGSTIGGAANRYADAAWLISQYDLTAGHNGSARNLGIQSAIWDLLDATGAHQMQGDWQAWMNSAVHSGGLGSFMVLTTTNVAGLSGAARYSSGAQEMITLGGVPNVSQTPEPQSAVMLGLGGLLIGVGLLRRKVSA